MPTAVDDGWAAVSTARSVWIAINHLPTAKLGKEYAVVGLIEFEALGKTKAVVLSLLLEDRFTDKLTATNTILFQLL